MSFRKPCHMPFRKRIPPFTLTGAREGDTRAPFFLAPTGSKGLLHRLVRVPRERARGGDSEIFVLSTSFMVHAIKVYDTSFINKTLVLFSHKTK